MDRKLRTDQSPVVDDGDQVAEVDQTISGDIEDAWFCTCDLVTHDTYSRPDSFREVTAFHSGRHTNAFDTTRSKFRTAIDFRTSRAGRPSSAVIHLTLKCCYAIQTVVRPGIWILKTTSAKRIRALVSNVAACLPWVPRAAVNLETLQFIDVVQTGQSADLWIKEAAGPGERP